MRKIGIDKFSPRHRQSSAVLLDCHLSKCMSIDGGVPSDQAIGTQGRAEQRLLWRPRTRVCRIAGFYNPPSALFRYLRLITLAPQPLNLRCDLQALGSVGD